MNAEIALRLTPHELDLVMRCLAKQPYETVVGVISKIAAQANSPELQNPQSFVHVSPPASMITPPTPPAPPHEVVAGIAPRDIADAPPSDGAGHRSPWGADPLYL